MKKLIKSQPTISLEENTIRITMYLYPEIYNDFMKVTSAVTFNKKDNRYHTDVNPTRIINGPLSKYGEQLENPIKGEYESFKKDCAWLVNELGFTIIHQETSITSEKSEYIIMFGIDDTPCGSLVYDLRISDHPFDATFPEELKTLALEYLQMNKVLDGTATEAGIDFEVEKVTVGSVKDDTWDKAFNRLYKLLKRIRNKIKVRLKTRPNA